MTGHQFLIFMYVFFSQFAALFIRGIDKDENLIPYKSNSKIINFVMYEILGFILCIPFVLLLLGVNLLMAFQVIEDSPL
ncbi:MAG: hypothetical protein A2Y82_00445 [Candidatus Buchananbacteria bacterium RBG_13_36_9]|uniref:Uncharacterized protein n=1 Tax=Candidatus Buchananbacteria bacterium RBG_13_36_9 TaxID=1797530 RepID=A0A1G1XQD6_9BACT|nr:MAG: hypothetical protein A2Y82_00445 [Candidatus Buchananbacteria bacterium RBG_13_36_9]